jgi:hypothetical protein
LSGPTCGRFHILGPTMVGSYIRRDSFTAAPMANLLCGLCWPSQAGSRPRSPGCLNRLRAPPARLPPGGRESVPPGVTHDDGAETSALL